MGGRLTSHDASVYSFPSKHGKNEFQRFEHIFKTRFPTIHSHSTQKDPCGNLFCMNTLYGYQKTRVHLVTLPGVLGPGALQDKGNVCVCVCVCVCFFQRFSCEE